ncbi:sugar transferase [Chitinophaga niabensis]|uniref:Sugar transferase involved in LPS biosynthesis (Colanic, teichoic acid) n=1 Tax=Chitinophaga niabensis TaxID=536979 RepID=A0A1N6EF53_9BACT|nr:sugar transferase [Chitinophaga niabensis]SIN81649.1 Sugar transferase involved in LPS biosynthesis (colanic, teichoic acid) [Chitinophaga niabensis]
MNFTTTPNILEAPSIERSNSARQTTDLSQIAKEERIVMIVGASLQATNLLPYYNYCMVEDTIGAQRKIMEMLNVNRTVPSVIIVQYNEQCEAACQKWSAYFASHQILKSIPFFLYAENVTEPLKTFVKKHLFIDEIITRECMERQLFSKIDFVKKIKRLQAIPDQTQAPKEIRYKKDYLNTFLKRGLDITAASLGLIVASPIMLLIAAAIRIESKGPIFYASKRAGRNYKVFKFYKFRSMVADADKKLKDLKHLNQYDASDSGPVFYKVSNDPRITKLGNFLRNSSLDELPQLFNVLKGDMSLVGNRPLPLYEATTLTTDVWVERFLAPAGITGLWQISKRGKKEMSVEERISLDIDYAYKNSFTYDMWLIVNTPLALIQKDNV